MLMLKALRYRPIALLWMGQALSSIGDEIYRVGLTWLAVGLIGENTGYLTAGQAAALMTLSFIGGKWADHWQPLTTMVRVDMIRAGLVLIPVACSFFMPVPLTLLVVVALTLSALGAFFDPALQTCLPTFSPSIDILRAATGLMSTTIRMARMIGPALVGLLAVWVPTIHFFTLDALSFAVSAFSVGILKREAFAKAPPAKIERHSVSLTDAIVAGFREMRKKEGMEYVLWAKAATGGTWNLAYGLGFALLINGIAPHDTRAFGLLIASYGLGNFLGALYFGNRSRHRSGLMMFSGYVLLGCGFVLVGLAPTLNWIMVASAATGFTGPMNDITFVDLVQKRFHLSQMTRIFRLRMATETASTLLFMLASPFLFRMLSVRSVIQSCGLVWILVGATGLLFFQRKVDSESNLH